MMSLTVTLVFGFVCLLALAAVVVTLREFGGSILALRDEVAKGAPRQTVYFAVSDLRTADRVLNLPVKRQAKPAQRHSLLAAA